MDSKTTKICFITTVSGTLSAFVIDFAKYIYEHTDWKIYCICDFDEAFSNSVPEYINYIPVGMKRGIDIRGAKVVCELVKIFRREKFDLVQYATPNASLYSALAGKLTDIPVRLYCEWGIVYTGFKGIKRWIFKQNEKLICKISSKIEPDSKGNLYFAVEEGLYPANKGEVIWNGSACGIDFKKFNIKKKDEWNAAKRKKYGISDDTVVFGFVGRITRDKGINELLYAYKNLKSQRGDAVLIIIGSNENDGTIDRELIDWALDQSSVIYAGYTDCVEEFMAMMNCLVLPSYREGFGLSVIEAGAMGVPVIVTDIPGPRDSVEDGVNGLVVEKENANSLCVAMRCICDDKEKREQMGIEGEKMVHRNYDRKVLFEQMLCDRTKLLNA